MSGQPNPSSPSALLCVALCLGLSASVSASGLDAEQNASGLGVSYAGASAVADNASVLHYNPAGLTLLQGVQFSLGATGRLHRYQFNDRGSSNINGDESRQAGKWQTLPHTYLAWAIAKDWSVGLGLSSPYSLKLDYGNDWLGRSVVTKAELDSLNFNPTLAYRVSDRLSLGAGLNYQKIRLKVAREGEQDSDADSDFGWNAGLLYTLSPAMRLGLAYRSGMEYRFDTPSLLDTFPGVNARGRFTTPDVFSFSVWQQVNDRWEAMGDFSYSLWQALDDYDEDGWRFAWGAAYAWDNQWKTKFGLAYDRSPISTSERLAILPDTHRLWFSIGAQYQFGKASALDFGYAYQSMKNPRLDNNIGSTTLRGNYDASGHILGIQYSQGF
ncbi:MAG: OmpP1/FadL family transporter [Zoogloeaceae bacterium]|nr:OmpP1/FadL family transporter [Zoogloeaceae bacterium]